MTNKERPILFSAPMVRAILDGRKTQTRRIVKNTEYYGCLSGDCPHGTQQECDESMPLFCPYGLPGDRLWVRECWGLFDTQPSDGPDRAHVFYRATDGDRYDLRYQLWRPSIHMPRWASRITLEVVAVKVERVQDISEADARAEGCDGGCPIGSIPHYQAAPCAYQFAQLWESINGVASWSENPWVWVVEFRRIEAK